MGEGYTTYVSSVPYIKQYSANLLSEQLLQRQDEQKSI